MNYLRHCGIKTLIVYSLIILSVFTACNEDEIDLPNQLYDQVIKVVKSSLGDSLITSDMESLTIPPFALSEDGTVFLGRTGSEPTSVPNEDLEIVGKPLTIKTPTGLIHKPLLLSLPIGTNSIDENNYHVVLFNGQTYYPVDFSVEPNRIKISIDVLDWEKTAEEVPTRISEIVVIALAYKQTPSEKEMGLKKISIDREGEMHHYEPSANSSSKVLLLVHGWLANSSKWINFMQDIHAQEEQQYSEYWTFSYNSSWSIEKNAKLLYDAVSAHANGAKIDIVGHSMGGLVSRSMLETFNGDIYINKLVTLGTPHLGSPLAVFRNVIGSLISDENSDDGLLYNYYSQGFKDLNVNSDFIQKMKELKEPPIPYYTIACTNNAQNAYGKIISELLLEGPDDGVVQVTSAKGVAKAVSPNVNVIINKDFAHMEMPNDDLIFEQVMDFLRIDE